jgi:hypothetical protein
VESETSIEMSKLTASTDLESVLLNRSVMIRFRLFLASIFSVENLTFWLEAGMWNVDNKRWVFQRKNGDWSVGDGNKIDGASVGVMAMAAQFRIVANERHCLKLFPIYRDLQILAG